MTRPASDARTGITAAGPQRRTRRTAPPAPAGSKEARRRAAAVLDVWTGVCTPMEAAAALSVSLPRFYAFETRLLDAMITACEDRPRGRKHRPDHELARLRQEVERLKRECNRKQALVRVVQRTAGLPLPDTRPVTKGRRRKKRPAVRALKIAANLRHDAMSDVPPAAGPATT